MADKPTGAGEHFARKFPEFTARHQAAIEAVRPQLEQIAEEARTADEAVRQEWQATYGEPLPQAYDEWVEWVELALVPGRILPAEQITSGEWTYGEILPIIRGFLRRSKICKSTSAQSPNPPRRNATVNARMLEKIQADRECHGWACTRWAAFLKCSRSTIVATPAWNELQSARETLKAGRALDRHRRTKGGRG